MDYLIPLIGMGLKRLSEGGYSASGGMPSQDPWPMAPDPYGPFKDPIPLRGIGPVDPRQWMKDHETQAKDKWRVHEEDPGGMDYDIPSGPQKRPRDPVEEETKVKTEDDPPPPPKKPREMPGLVMPKAIQTGT